jgi:hypothetical protein
LVLIEEKAMRTYWSHPESESFFAVDGAPDGGDGMAVEMSREEYHAGLLARFHDSAGPYRVVAFGGRDFSDGRLLEGSLDDFHAEHGIAVLINGRAPGADKRADAWAKKRGIETDPYPARWDDLTQPGARIVTRANGTKYDAAEGGRRNQRMIDEGRPDVGIAFKGGSGTADMKDRCELAGVLVFEVA